MNNASSLRVFVAAAAVAAGKESSTAATWPHSINWLILCPLVTSKTVFEKKNLASF